MTYWFQFDEASAHYGVTRTEKQRGVGSDIGKAAGGFAERPGLLLSSRSRRDIYLPKRSISLHH